MSTTSDLMAMLVGFAIAVPPAASIDFAAAADPSAERDAITTRAPSRAKSSAIALPMPRPAPVTMAVRPASRNWLLTVASDMNDDLPSVSGQAQRSRPADAVGGPGHQHCSGSPGSGTHGVPHFCVERRDVSVSPPTEGGSRAESPFDSPPEGEPDWVRELDAAHRRLLAGHAPEREDAPPLPRDRPAGAGRRGRGQRLPAVRRRADRHGADHPPLPRPRDATRRHPRRAAGSRRRDPQ